MKLTADHLGTLSAQVAECAHEHPKAHVFYDTETHEIRITYPLPDDLLRLQRVDLTRKGSEFDL